MSVWATAWAWEQEIESPGQKLVLLALAQFADELAQAFPSQQTIAEMTHQGQRTVRRHLADLELAKLIQRDARTRKDGTRTSDLFQLAGGMKPCKVRPMSEQPGDENGEPAELLKPAAKLAGCDNTQRPIQAEQSAKNDGATGHFGQGSYQGINQRINHSGELSPVPPRKLGPRTWPEGFALTDSMKAYANDRGVDPIAEFDAWNNDCLAHARIYSDWVAAWRTRIDKVPRFEVRPGTALVPTSSSHRPYLTPGNQRLMDAILREERGGDGAQQRDEDSAQSEIDLAPTAFRRVDRE